MQAQWAQGIEAAHKLRQELQRQQTETQNIQAQWTQGIQEVNHLKEELKTHQKEAQKIQTQLMQGIQPQFYATMQDIEDARKTIQYDPENLHLAIAGHSGTGKPSLVNAFRRISDIHPQAAKTGVTETILLVGRYPDPDPELPFKRFIWYDIPGSGTASISDWQYFKTQGLFVFDVLILVVSGCFLDSDIELLKNCARYNVPTFFVWSKADIPINDFIAKERANNQQMEEEDLDMDNFAGPAPPTEQEYTTAKNKFYDQTRMNIKDQLHQKGLPDQRVYVVTRKGI
jgi:GTP-binding protein EngB required for normal cell division